MLRHWFLCLRCAGLGTLIGAIPGLGGTVVDWIAYGHVVQTAKDKSQFGKGDIRGVVAPESANNAKEGGGLVPTLLFGIPGSGAMAVFLGGMVLLGIEAGPAMVTSDLDLTYTIIWSLALANVLGAGSCMLLARPIAGLTTIPFNRLAPFMIMVVSFAAFPGDAAVHGPDRAAGGGRTGHPAQALRLVTPGVFDRVCPGAAGGGLSESGHAVLRLGHAHPAGALSILTITVVSVWLGSRGARDAHRPGRRGLRRQATRARRRARPSSRSSAQRQPCSCMRRGAAWGCLRWAACSRSAVAAVTLVLCGYLIAVLSVGAPESAANFDLEQAAGTGAKSPVWQNAGWFVVLTLATALLGFVPATLVFFVAFLRLKARESWRLTLLLAAAAGGVLAALNNLLLVELPGALVPLDGVLAWAVGR